MILKNLIGKKSTLKTKLEQKIVISQQELKKMLLKKNMKHGSNKIFFLLIFFLTSFSVFAEERILSSPLINLENLKPSFEEEEEINKTNIDDVNKNKLKNKKENQLNPTSQAKLIGLDKITAKSSEIVVNLNEIKKFGPLEIKILKCGKIKNNNIIDDVAYLQVKDLSKTENDKVFIFNGWTFASDPSLAPFDHAIYDIQLLNCNI